MNAGDTFYDINTIEQVMLKKTQDAELIYGDMQIKDTGHIKKAWDQSLWYIHTPFCHQSLFSLTKLMKKYPFDTSYTIASDQDFMLKMHTKKRNFCYIPQPIAVFALGGFSMNNEFSMNIESLKLLLDYNIPQSIIEQSDWYKVLSSNLCRKNKKRIIQSRENHSNQLSTLKDAIHSITKYSIWKQPLQKYKSYKTMLLTYRKIKKDEIKEGREIGNK